MKDELKSCILLVVIIWVIAFMQVKDEKAHSRDEYEQAVSKRLAKLDYIEAANIRECMAKFGTSENVSAVIERQVLTCKTKLGHLIGRL